MWPSVRRELIALGRCIPFLQYRAYWKYKPVLFASDAMGANDFDKGGYALVATDVTQTEIDMLRTLGEAPGHSIARADGALSGLKHEGRSFVPTVPFSRLPDQFTTDRWTCFNRGYF